MKIAVLGSYSTQILLKSLVINCPKVIRYMKLIIHQLIMKFWIIILAYMHFVLIIYSYMKQQFLSKFYHNENNVNQDHYKLLIDRLENLVQSVSIKIENKKIIICNLENDNEMTLGNYFQKYLHQ